MMGNLVLDLQEIGKCISLQHMIQIMCTYLPLENFLSEGSMPKDRLREVNNYLLYSLMGIITFSERTVGVVSKPGEGRQEL